MIAALPEKLSLTDPDATWSAKHGPAALAYYDHYLIDNASCIIVGVEATPARFSEETSAAKQMLLGVKTQFGLEPTTLGADKGYGSAEFVNWLWEQGVSPHLPLIDRQKQTKNAFTNDDFIQLPTQNAYRCPEGKLLSYVGRDQRSQQHIYRSTETQCRSCAEKDKCTSGRVKKIGVSWYEEARRRARLLVGTPEFLRSRRARSKVEALFSELKQQIGLSRLRLRRIRHASEQFLLAATAQNLKRLVRFLTVNPPKAIVATR